MTVPTDQVKQFANGNGTTTVFYFYYRLLLATDLQVYVNSTLVLPSNYTVTINPIGLGGHVTFTSAPPAGVQNVLLYRFVDYLQETHFPNESDFNQVTLEDSVDKLTMECQQLQEEVSRCIIAPLTSPDIPFLSLPEPVPNTAIGWDPSGTFLVDLPLSGILGPTGPTGATGATGPAGSDMDIVILEDQRPSPSTLGGIPTAAWTPLQLNTKVLDTANICTLLPSPISPGNTQDQFTLPAGTYRVRACSTGNNTNGHSIRLRNVTDSTTELVGMQAWNNVTNALTGYAATYSNIDGVFTIGSTKTLVFEIIIAHASTYSGSPGGTIATGEVTIFTRAVIERGGTGPQGPTGPAGGGGTHTVAIRRGDDGSVYALRTQTNISSVTKDATGVYTINFSVPYAAINYSVSVQPIQTTGPSASNVYCYTVDQQVGLAQIRFQTPAGAAGDPEAFIFAALGL